MELRTYICLCLEGNKLNSGGNSLSETVRHETLMEPRYLHIFISTGNGVTQLLGQKILITMTTIYS